MRVHSDHERVSIEIETAMAGGRIRATVVMPRAGIFCVPALSRFSEEELAVLVFLNAGVPSSWKAAPYFRWWHMVGLTSKQSIGSRLRELSKDCPHDDQAIARAVTALEKAADIASAADRFYYADHFCHLNDRHQVAVRETRPTADLFLSLLLDESVEKACLSCSAICRLELAPNPASKLQKPRRCKHRYRELPSRNALLLDSRLTPRMVSSAEARLIEAARFKSWYRTTLVSSGTREQARGSTTQGSKAPAERGTRP